MFSGILKGNVVDTLYFSVPDFVMSGFRDDKCELITDTVKCQSSRLLDC